MLSTLFKANNKISSLSGLENLTGLEHLNLQHNEVSSVEEISKLTNLVQLDLSFNSIDAFEEVTKINQLETIRKLAFQGNPVASVPQFRENVVLRIPQLKHLDSTVITQADRDSAQAFYEEQMADMVT